MNLAPRRLSPALLHCLLATIIYFAGSTHAASLVISEFMAANINGLADEDGEYSDWIEIYNPTGAAVPLAGWALSDNPDTPAKWIFPTISIPSHGFLTVFASGKNRLNPAGKLHTNFSLNSSGESLLLSDPQGNIVSSILNYPRQLAGVSYGVSMVAQSDILFPFDGTARAFVATVAPPANWMQTGFDDSAWSAAAMGIGYDRILPGQTDPSEPTPAAGDVTAPGDLIVATSINSPDNEGVMNAIDNKVATKYLNFDKLNTGFTVTASNETAVVIGLKLTSANDAPERDPASFVLSGSNDGAAFTEIARGSIPTFTTRFQTLQVNFTNTATYKQYRLLFPTVQNAPAAVAMQIAEVEFLGKSMEPPPSLLPFIASNLETDIYNKAVSVAVRTPFTLGAGQLLENPTLRLRYDDGFAAWLNGTLIAQANTPGSFVYNGLAPTNRYRRDAVRELRLNLTPYSNLLQAGANLLAVQIWNDRLGSADFLLQAQLEDTRFTVGSYGYFPQPTPAAENSTAKDGTVDDVVPSEFRGFYSAAFDLSLRTITPDAVIRYTTNGSEPTATTGALYTGPIRIDRTTVLRAAAFRDNWLASRVTAGTYIFVDDVVKQTQASALAAGLPANWAAYPADYGLDSRIVGPNDNYGGKYAATIKSDLKAVPAISLVLDNADIFGPQGIYPNAEAHGDVWERPLSIELINPDGSVGFQENAGIRIQGGAFRRFDLTMKKSFRVVFREEYGAGRLHFPLFGANAAGEFQNFVLRANANDAWPYFGGNAVYSRDAFAMESIRAMGSTSSHVRYVHLFINGWYWGLYNLVERPDAAFSASYYGGDRDTWDAINQDSAPDGNYDAWNRLLTALNGDVSKPDVYQRLQGNNPDGTRNPNYENLIDVDSMIDYMIMNLYIGNVDWPHRNWWTGRDRNDGDGFKFYPWDSETALFGPDANVIDVSTAVAFPYSRLRLNAEFRMRFADHLHRHFFNGGAFYVNPAAPAWNPSRPTNNVPAARFFAISEQIRSAVVGESARWGDQKATGPFTRDEHWSSARNGLLNNFFPQRSAIVLEQFRVAGLYPRTAAPVFNLHGGTVDAGFQLTMTAAQGTIYYTTNGADPRDLTTSKSYSGAITLNDLTTIKARVLNGAEWSALAEAHFTVGQPNLVLSEMHYHPTRTTAEERAAGFLDNEAFEYIELWNKGAASVDLSNLAFTRGIQFNFANASTNRLGPNQYILVIADRAAFEKRYGPGLPIAGIYTGHLDNGGERIQLLNGTNTVFDFAYGAGGVWPSSPDGNGPSLQPINPNANLNIATNWQASAFWGGSPGKANPPHPVRFQNATIEGAQLRFTFPGKAGAIYVVSATDSLTAPQWQVVQTFDALTADQPVQALVDLAPAPGTRFFRVAAQLAD